MFRRLLAWEKIFIKKEPVIYVGVVGLMGMVVLMSIVSILVRLYVPSTAWWGFKILIPALGFAWLARVLRQTIQEHR